MGRIFSCIIRGPAVCLQRLKDDMKDRSEDMRHQFCGYPVTMIGTVSQKDFLLGMGVVCGDGIGGVTVISLLA